MDFNRQEQKDLFKEALKEWLDEKAAQFGKWTIKYLVRALFGAAIYFVATHGWIK